MEVKDYQHAQVLTEGSWQIQMGEQVSPELSPSSHCVSDHSTSMFTLAISPISIYLWHYSIYPILSLQIDSQFYLNKFILKGHSIPSPNEEAV